MAFENISVKYESETAEPSASEKWEKLEENLANLTPKMSSILFSIMSTRLAQLFGRMRTVVTFTTATTHTFVC